MEALLSLEKNEEGCRADDTEQQYVVSHDINTSRLASPVHNTLLVEQCFEVFLSSYAGVPKTAHHRLVEGPRTSWCRKEKRLTVPMVYRIDFGTPNNHPVLHNPQASNAHGHEENEEHRDDDGV